MWYLQFFLFLDCEPYCEQLNSHGTPRLPEQGSLHQDAEVNCEVYHYFVYELISM